MVSPLTRLPILGTPGVSTSVREGLARGAYNVSSIIHHWSAAAVGGASASGNTEEVSSPLLIAVWNQEAESDCLKMVVWHAAPEGQRSEVNEACAVCEEDMLKVQGRTFTTSGIPQCRCS